MSAARPDEGVDDLVRLARRGRAGCWLARRDFEPADHDCGQTAGCAGDQADAGGIETGIQRGESLREAVEAEARVIDQIPREHLCQVQPGQLHARGDDGLECGQLRSLPTVQREGLVAGAIDVSAAEIEAIAQTVIDLYEEVVAVEKIRDGVDVVGAADG